MPTADLRRPGATVGLLSLLTVIGLAVTGCAAGDDTALTPTPTPDLRSTTRSEPPTSSPTPSTRTPMVVAVHPSRGTVALTSSQVTELSEGALTDWWKIDGTPGPLRIGSVREVIA